MNIIWPYGARWLTLDELPNLRDWRPVEMQAPPKRISSRLTNRAGDTSPPRYEYCANVQLTDESGHPVFIVRRPARRGQYSIGVADEVSVTKGSITEYLLVDESIETVSQLCSIACARLSQAPEGLTRMSTVTEGTLPSPCGSSAPPRGEPKSQANTSSGLTSKIRRI